MPQRRLIFASRTRLALRRVSRLLVVLAAFAFVALLVYGLSTKAANTSIDDALHRGETQPAPGFELRVLAQGRAASPRWVSGARDGRVDLDELRGTPVAVNFWASWCDPCRAEASRLERHWRTAKRRGVLFIGLNQQDAREDARDFLTTIGLWFPQVRDAGNDTARAWGVTGYSRDVLHRRAGAASSPT